MVIVPLILYSSDIIFASKTCMNSVKDLAQPDEP